MRLSGNLFKNLPIILSGVLKLLTNILMRIYCYYLIYTVANGNEGDRLNIIISNALNQPIYEQIYIQIKNHIISGELSEGDLLPSIRTLAKDLRISVITAKCAYDELEKEGFIYTVSGKGCYVAEKNTELIREGNLRQIEEYMRKIIELAPACRLTNSEVVEMFRVILKEE